MIVSVRAASALHTMTGSVARYTSLQVTRLASPTIRQQLTLGFQSPCLLYVRIVPGSTVLATIINDDNFICELRPLAISPLL